MERRWRTLPLVVLVLGVLLVGVLARGLAPAAVSTPAAPSRAAAVKRVRFAVLGDFGTGGADQLAVARRMCRWQRGHRYAHVVTTGDNVYPDGARHRFRAAFFRPYRCLHRRDVKFHSSLGNHDYITARGRPELRAEAFGIPSRNYVVSLRGVRFVVANSNRLRRGWLRRKLRAGRDARWTIVVFHHPVFSPGLHGSTPGFRSGLPRLFRRAGVDLVLNGHDHIYSVTKRLRRIRYVVTGGGGAPLYGCSPRWFVDVCKERHHFLYVVAGSRRIRVRAVPARGQPFGRFSTLGRTPGE